MSDTKDLIRSSDPLKHKTTYIAGYINLRFCDNTYMEVEGDDTEILSDVFVNNLSKGGSSLPTLSYVYFAHIAYQINASLKLHFSIYFAKLLPSTCAPINSNVNAC